MAHRGASSESPENTLSAIRRAISLEADLIELDVQRSRDGALVLMHDKTLARTTDAPRLFPTRGPWRVADFTLDELSRLDAGSWKSGTFEGEPVPTLDEALELIGNSHSGLLLELKAPELYPGIVSDVVTAMAGTPGYLESALAGRRLVVQSFDYAAMKDHKTQAPEVPVGLLGSPDPSHLPVLATWADQVNPHHLAVDRAYVERIQRLGMECHVWTVNRVPAFRRALSLGVDGVITNRPRLLGQVLAGDGRARQRPRVATDRAEVRSP